VGQSGSGKTTLIEKLLPELKGRGYRIGTVKHTHHEIQADQEGKDSARHKSAGASVVILASPGRISLVKDMECDSLDCLEPYFQDMDLVITEGYKKENRPKIEVFRTAAHTSPLYNGGKDFAAVVTDSDADMDIPKFGLEDVKNLADFIEKIFISKKQGGSGGMKRRRSDKFF
jgi:molybdopterin-guanine dinucleotide biosynthesis protein MobB